MEPATVIGLVTALFETFADGHEDYSSWKRKRASGNHYHGRGLASPPCALSTLLLISGPQIKDTYDKAVQALGTDFSTGDAWCRSTLWSQLNILSDRVAILHRAAGASVSVALDLADAVQVCEGVRRASLRALIDQYSRLAVGRPIPKALAVPKPNLTPHRLVQSTDINLSRDDDRMTMITAITASTDQLRFQSEPPSPPPTPKVPEQTTDEPGPSRRPANSVFALFCPEALGLQVNTKKKIPATAECNCGYSWKHLLTDSKDALRLKEGFQLTVRFLVKSHHSKDGYGCVLCTSSGKSEKYDGIEQLRDHINASHTKWQLLHDTDCRAS
ncbi:hypothetical protein NLU13_7577 [Sarocladium strictum]|uniref:Uncharacterized protein n=1 Tax=Sarocladium strictum TaxID=5046 RepID=A0AA39L5Y4_SARSR|nr:hypothetical protein NLU13_7577 [Sarocladium strictum]